MKFLVSSPEKPEDSPLYSVHTDLDSFIFCNDESLGELESEIRDTNKGVETIYFNIMATLDLEENKEEICKQCNEIKTPSKKETE